MSGAEDSTATCRSAAIPRTPSSGSWRSSTRRACTPALRRSSVQTVERFDAAVRVTRGSETVGGTSIMGLMMLGAATGTTITVEATGNEAAAAVDALDKLVSSGFGEED